MLEILKVIAALCTIHGGGDSAGAAGYIDGQQRACQVSLTSCVLKRLPFIEEKALALCVVERK